MKKSKVLLGTLLSGVVILSGCSSKNENTSSTNSTSSSKDNNNTNENNTTSNSDSGIKNEVVISNANFNVSGETSEFKVTVTAVQTSNLSITNQEILNTTRLENGARLVSGKSYAYVLMELEVENKTDRDLDIFVNKAKLVIKDTKEQLENNMTFSTSNYNYSFLPSTKKTVKVRFITDNIKAEDIKNVVLRVDKPYTKNSGDSIYFEPITLDFEIK